MGNLQSNADTGIQKQSRVKQKVLKIKELNSKKHIRSEFNFNNESSSDSDISMTPSISYNQRVISDGLPEIITSFCYNNIESSTIKRRVDIVNSILFGIISGTDLKLSSKSHDISQLFFLRSLRDCIADQVGSQYLFKYLHKNYCDEMVMFLYLLSIFKKTEHDAQLRFIITQNICQTCIDSQGSFAINISYDHRQTILFAMKNYEKKRRNNLDKKCPEIDMEFFIDIEDQVCRLILQTHWNKFIQYMNQL